MPEWSKGTRGRDEIFVPDEKVEQAFEAARALDGISTLDVARLAPGLPPAVVLNKALSVGTLEVITAAAEGDKLTEVQFWQRLVMLGFLAGYELGREVD